MRRKHEDSARADHIKNAARVERRLDERGAGKRI
jgi:hypothetical protein